MRHPDLFCFFFFSFLNLLASQSNVLKWEQNVCERGLNWFGFAVIVLQLVTEGSQTQNNTVGSTWSASALINEKKATHTDTKILKGGKKQKKIQFFLRSLVSSLPLCQKNYVQNEHKLSKQYTLRQFFNIALALIKSINYAAQ